MWRRVIRFGIVGATSRSSHHFSPLSPVRLWGKSGNQAAGRGRSSTFLIAGIGSIFGFSKKKEEEDGEKMSDEDMLILQIKKGILAMQRDQLEESEAILHMALNLAKSINHEDGISYVHTVLADLAFKRGNFAQCRRLYVDVMKRELAKGVPTNSNSMVEMSLRLAFIYAHNEELSKAEQGFLFCIKTQEDKVIHGKEIEGEEKEDSLALWGMSKDWYAQFLVKQKRYQEALTQFQEAQQTSSKLSGESADQSLVLLNSVAIVFSFLGKNDEAISNLNKAIQLGRQSQSPHLGSFLVNLGVIQMKQGLAKEASRSCSEAIRLAKDDPLPDPQIRSCHDILEQLKNKV